MSAADSPQDVEKLPHAYLFAVPHLELSDEWIVGEVELHPAGATTQLVDAERALRKWGRNEYDNTLDTREVAELDRGSVVLVHSTDPRVAYKLASDALGVLRLLAASRHPRVNTEWQTFGLEGELLEVSVPYIDLDAGPGGGWFHEGAAPGWAFNHQDRVAFEDNRGLQFLANTVTRMSPHDSGLRRRLQLGIRLLNNSFLEYDADRKLLSLVTSLEVLLGESKWQGKKFGIARRAAYLSCSIPQNSMCGRDRASCPYLALDPSGKVPAQLKDLVQRSKTDTNALCSFYRHIFDLYEWRNDVVHEGTSGRSFDDVKHASWRVNRWLIPPLLEWCADHPEDDDRAAMN